MKKMNLGPLAQCSTASTLGHRARGKRWCRGRRERVLVNLDTQAPSIDASDHADASTGFAAKYMRTSTSSICAESIKRSAYSRYTPEVRNNSKSAASMCRSRLIDAMIVIAWDSVLPDL